MAWHVDHKGTTLVTSIHTYADQREAGRRYASTLPESERLSPPRLRLLRLSQQIRASYADGVPLNDRDAHLVMHLLRNHPRAAEKIGPGVEALIVDRFVADSRCFFAVRVDGTVVDFSVRKCLGQPRPPRSARVAAAMDAFRYGAVYRRYQGQCRREVAS